MWPNPDVLAYVEVGVAGPESHGKTADREAAPNAVYLAKLSPFMQAETFKTTHFWRSCLLTQRYTFENVS